MPGAIPPLLPCVCVFWCLIKNKDSLSLALHDRTLDTFPYMTAVSGMVNDNAAGCDTVQLRYRVWNVINCQLKDSELPFAVRVVKLWILVDIVLEVSTGELCRRWGDFGQFASLTLSLLTWKIWWTPNNAGRRQMGFKWAFKGVNHYIQVAFQIFNLYLMIASRFEDWLYPVLRSLKTLTINI